jgi:hypothetical protein
MDLVNPTTLLERVTRAAALAGCGSDDERARLLRALEAVTPEAVAAHRAQRPAPNTEEEQGDSELYESLEGLPKQFKRNRKH